MVRDDPTEIGINGTAYRGRFTTAQPDILRMEDAGYDPSSEGEVTLTSSALGGGAPANLSSMTIRGKTYKVMETYDCNGYFRFRVTKCE